MQFLDADHRVNALPMLFGAQSESSGNERNAPLAALLGHDLAPRYHAWHGLSGRRYIASVFTIDPENPSAGLPDLGQAVLIAVARHGFAREAKGVAAIERTSDWARAVARLAGSADEWHVHFLAPDRAGRASVCADLDEAQRLAGVA